MNITELNQALHAIADEVTDDSRTRLASVTRRMQIARRSKVAGTIVTTCLVVMALVFLPNWRGLSDSDPEPQADNSLFGSLATIRTGDFLIYKDAGGVRLLKSRVASAGEHIVKVSVTPKTGNIGWTQPCQLSGASELHYHLLVNGHQIPSAALESLRYKGLHEIARQNSTCDHVGSPMHVERTLSLSPTGNVAAWRALGGVQSGRPARFKLRVTADHDAAGKAALAKAKPMLAIFEMPRHPVQTHGLWVERHVVDPPGATGAFELVHRQFVKPNAGRTQLSVPVPQNGQELYVRAFVKNGEGSGVTLSAGPPTHDELETASGSWDVEKTVAAGPSVVKAGIATVPPRTQRWVVILVYVKYE